MKKTAVEWLAQKLFKINSSSTTDMDGTIKFLEIEFKDLFEQAKEMEKQQKGYSEEEVLKFGQWLSEFNNLDNESEYVIKELLEQFKNK